MISGGGGRDDGDMDLELDAFVPLIPRPGCDDAVTGRENPAEPSDAATRPMEGRRRKAAPA
ncbi:hypothetical protein GCM10010156_08340 [Planobispora rosea]|uniref:Uncharacterized protein n=1 Tax=Planobispora rosea TaxID=35762 RepID=A0A8J3WAN9_PLARO|nr:hypothetical protein GCM10010156_08340 [Planobispora rosea]GIH82999.1 hypothetical protein Pro02_14070 [Planobispora rosea]